MGLVLASARLVSRARPVWFFALWLGYGLAMPQGASAFCRESLQSQSQPQAICTEDPSVPALFWDRSCLTYIFNAQVFGRVPMGETFVRTAYKASYQSWADVHSNPPANLACGTRADPPFFVAQAAATTATNTSEFRYDEPNESIVVLRNRAEWAGLDDHDPNALALTLLWHDKKTGEILDVDMELNGGAGTFTDCATNCSSVTEGIDLQNTVTHEAGHLLGLGHSNVPGSTMQASTTRSGETSKRSLELDDQAGYCALDLPKGPCAGAGCSCPAPPVFPSRRTSSGCSCRALTPAQSSEASHVSFAALALVLGLSARAQARRRSKQAARP